MTTERMSKPSPYVFPGINYSLDERLKAIAMAVCEEHGITWNKLMEKAAPNPSGKCRGGKRISSTPRQEAMYLMHRIAKDKEIASFFDLQRTTIVSGRRTVEKLISGVKPDQEVKGRIERIKSKIY